MLTFSYKLFSDKLVWLPNHGPIGPGADVISITMTPEKEAEVDDFLSTNGVKVIAKTCLNPIEVQEYVRLHGTRKLGQAPPHLLESGSTEEES